MVMSKHADYDKQVDISRQSANAILPIIFELLSPNSITDVGCGVGAWLGSAISLGGHFEKSLGT